MTERKNILLPKKKLSDFGNLQWYLNKRNGNGGRPCK